MKGKIDIIASLTPPSIHDVWLNLNDNKLYRYGADGWMSLIDNRKPGQSGGSTNLAVQSDWLASKPVLPEYIKNRTHYLEVINTYNEPGTYDLPGNYPKRELKFALINSKGEDIIVDVPYDNYGVNINEYIRVDVVDDQFRLIESTLGSLELTPLKIVVINKHLNESYLPEDIKADFMQPDENKQSFIYNNPFFRWREIVITSAEVKEGTINIALSCEGVVYISNGIRHFIVHIGTTSRILSTEGDPLAIITHHGTYLQCSIHNSGRFWIAQANSVTNWDVSPGEMGYIENKPFNGGVKIHCEVGRRVSFTDALNSFNPDTLRLRYEGKYYRLPHLPKTSVNIDGAFNIIFIGSSVTEGTQTYNYITQNINSEGRDQFFTIESNIGATELCDLNIPNTIARNWKILKNSQHSDNFPYNPNILENHTYYVLESSPDAPVYKLTELSSLIDTTLLDVLELKFFISDAGSETTPFSFNTKGTIHWEGGFPKLTGQPVEITIKYIGNITLGSVKIYE